MLIRLVTVPIVSLSSWPSIHLPGGWAMASGAMHGFVLFVSHPCIVATINTYVPVFASWVGAHWVRTKVPFVTNRTPSAAGSTKAGRCGKWFPTEASWGGFLVGDGAQSQSSEW